MITQRIIIVTDCTDVAASELRGTILKETKGNPDIVVEPVVYAKEFSLINGAFIIRLLAETYDPQSTIFLAVLNPLRTNTQERARIIGVTANGIRFVGANTGIFGWLIQEYGLKELVEVKPRNLTGSEFISFGGKYIHAPIAAKIALGKSPSHFGKKRNQNFLVDLSIENGTVVHIDNFGVIKVRGTLNDFKEGNKIELTVNGKRKLTAIYSRCMKDLEDGTLTIFPGSAMSNLPEIGFVRQLGTAEKLKINIGDIIKWKMK